MKKHPILVVALLFPFYALAQGSRPTGPYGQDATTSSVSSPARKTVVVECSNPSARVKTVAVGLRMLGDTRPAALLVSGTCRENVTIQGLDRITLQGNPTATIHGGSDPNLGTVELVDAVSIDLVDLTITGGGEGVGCVQCLGRLTRVSIQDTLGLGVNASARSHLLLTDSSVRSNADAGILVGNAATVNLVNTSVTSNGSDGAFLNAGATLLVFSSPITGNSGYGINASLQGTVVLNGATVTGNAADGVTIQGGSAMRTTRSMVSGNQGHQVRIGDLSFARFGAATTVAGSTFPDVLCDGASAATRGIGNLVGVTTNCPAEQAPAP